MTEYEANGLKKILRVLEKYVRGDHHAKRYTPEHRREDKARIQKIKNKLASYEQSINGSGISKGEQPAGTANPKTII